MCDAPHGLQFKFYSTAISSNDHCSERSSFVAIAGYVWMDINCVLLVSFLHFTHIRCAVFRTLSGLRKKIISATMPIVRREIFLH